MCERERESVCARERVCERERERKREIDSVEKKIERDRQCGKENREGKREGGMR